MLIFKILSFTIITLGGISVAYGSEPGPETEAAEKEEATCARSTLLTEKLETLPAALEGLSVTYGSGVDAETETPEKDDAARSRTALLTEKLEARPDVKDALKRLEIRIQSLFKDGKKMYDLVPLQGPYLNEKRDLDLAFSTCVTSLIPDTETELKDAIVAVRDCYELIARACTAIGNNHKVTKEETAMCIRKFEGLSLKTAESIQLQNSLNGLFVSRYSARTRFLNRFYG